jgi:predicted nucleic acid-binding protein
VTHGPLILDTGGWLWALAGEEAYAEALESARPAIVPTLVLAEVDWHLRSRRAAMHRILREIDEGRYVVEAPTKADLARAAQLDRKFPELGLGLVDASIAALAERLGTDRVLTIDRDLTVVRIGRGYRRALTLAVPLPKRRR